MYSNMVLVREDTNPGTGHEPGRRFFFWCWKV